MHGILPSFPLSRSLSWQPGRHGCLIPVTQAKSSMLVEPPASICPESDSRTGHSLGMDWTRASTPSVPTLSIEAVPLPPPTFQKLPLSGPSVPSTSSLGQGPVIRQMLMTLGLKGEGPELGSLYFTKTFLFPRKPVGATRVGEKDPASPGIWSPSTHCRAWAQAMVPPEGQTQNSSVTAYKQRGRSRGDWVPGFLPKRLTFISVHLFHLEMHLLLT